MNSKLLIISDLWGLEHQSWINFYLADLANFFEITAYDSRDLAGISPNLKSGSDLHQQFVKNGIERAVSKLQSSERQKVDVLAFSVGGTIAWKAAIAGMPIEHLFAVSSTRLRFETQKPETNIHLMYGQLDPHKPTSDWFSKMNITPTIFNKVSHDFYRDHYFARKINQIIRP